MSRMYWRLLLVPLLLAAALVAVASLAACGQETEAPTTSDIDADERVIFFPTAASFDAAAQAWIVPVHAWVFEPEEYSIKRDLAVELLGEPFSDEVEDSPVFQARARLFLVDNERGQTIQIEIAGERETVGTSGANGHVEATLRIPAARHGAAVQDTDEPNPWLSFDLVMQEGDEREFAGSYQLVAPVGLSVVSDIDDTIKLSEVHDRRALLRRSFLEDFEAIEGMPAVYARLAAHDAVFHYLSSSPWQLYELLADLLETADFPRGSFHLKHFRVKDESFWDLFASPMETKLPALEQILDHYPQRRFVLFGDAVEEDPEVYGELARRHPEQVVGIFIRIPLPHFADAARFGQAFADVPSERWTTFTESPALIDHPLFEAVLAGSPRAAPAKADFSSSARDGTDDD